jgi:hypothetical protein
MGPGRQLGSQRGQSRIQKQRPVPQPRRACQAHRVVPAPSSDAHGLDEACLFEAPQVPREDAVAKAPIIQVERDAELSKREARMEPDVFVEAATARVAEDERCWACLRGHGPFRVELRSSRVSQPRFPNASPAAGAH